MLVQRLVQYAERHARAGEVVNREGIIGGLVFLGLVAAVTLVIALAIPGGTLLGKLAWVVLANAANR